MGFERFDVNVAGFVPRGLGEQGVDHADHRRTVLGVEQVSDFRHVLHQAVEVDFVFCCANHSGGAACIGVGRGEQAVEFIVAHAPERRLTELPPHLADRPAGGRWAYGQHAVAQQNALGLGPGVGQ